MLQQILLDIPAGNLGQASLERGARRKADVVTNRARRVVFGEKSAEGKTWADQLMHTFKHDGYDAVWEQVVEWRATLGRSPAKRKAADQLLNYVSARQEMIRYPEFLAKGWQIGSGPIEAQCELTVGRLKGRGRRFRPPQRGRVG